MYQIDRIFNAYQNEIKGIREINEAMKQICEETKSQEGINITNVSGTSDDFFKTQMRYEGNNIEFNIKYMELIDIFNNYYRYFPNDLKNLTVKDKLIRIFEERATETIIKIANVVE